MTFSLANERPLIVTVGATNSGKLAIPEKVVQSNRHFGPTVKERMDADWTYRHLTHHLERLKTFYETYFAVPPRSKYVNPVKQFEFYFLRFDSGARLNLMARRDISGAWNDPPAQFTLMVPGTPVTVTTKAWYWTPMATGLRLRCSAAKGGER